MKRFCWLTAGGAYIIVAKDVNMAITKACHLLAKEYPDLTWTDVRNRFSHKDNPNPDEVHEITGDDIIYDVD